MADLPDLIGRFRVQGLLGRGAMGVVYKALDPEIDRIVAIKLVRTDLLAGDDRAHYLARFRNEARTVGRCVHPNIVAIHDLSVHEGNPFLVLEYVDGTDLGRAHERGTVVDLSTVVRIVTGVLDALGYAHGFGIVHRDVKPANVLLTRDGTIKVTDFGISRLLSSEATVSSVLVGTPCYMSPEQCLGNAIDARSDIFSVGSLLYEMLSGERCFAAPNLVATTLRILHEEPTPLRDLRPDLPEAVAKVVGTALAKRPEDRFGSAAEMARALRGAMPPDLSRTGDEDATIVAPRIEGVRRSVRSSAGLEALQGGTVAEIERRLAHHLGPMARIHLRRALRDVSTPEELGQALADLLPDQTTRDRMRNDLLRLISSDAGLLASRSGQASGPGMDPIGSSRSEDTRPGSSGLSPGTVDTVGEVLASIMGPIAPHLLRRVLKTARTPEQLQAACEALIDDEDERVRFAGLLASRSWPPR